MNRNEPPPWLQRTLLLFLLGRDRETILGDLLEEYREQQLPRVGSMRADVWYARQLISFPTTQVLGGPILKQTLIAISLFLAAAGTWLGVMENILKHEGYGGRSVIAALIAIQGLATLLFVLVKAGSVFRKLIMCGAVAILLLGITTVFKISHAQHFEGFVFVIATALILHGTITLATMLQMRHNVA